MSQFHAKWAHSIPTRDSKFRKKLFRENLRPSSFMNPYILALRRYSSKTTSTDSHWLFTTLRNQLWALMNWQDSVPTCPAAPPPHVHISACYCFPRWYPTSATCPAHMRPDQWLKLWTTADRNLNRKWNQDHTDGGFDVLVQSSLC